MVGYTKRMSCCFEKYIFRVIFCLFVVCTSIHTASANLISMERIMKANRYFIDFIDVSVSNYGNNEIITSFKLVNKLNYEAKIALFQSEYSKSLELVKASQKVLQNIYYEMLSNVYRKNTELLLNIAAPIIVQAKDRKAEFFLRRGYRSLKLAERHEKIGFSWNRFLFSGKIRHYLDGIKNARQGKKYVFWALIESKTPLKEKSNYKLQTLDEALNPDSQNDPEIFSNYKKVRNKLKTYINQNLISRKLTKRFRFFLHHDDNYGFVYPENKSIKFEFFETLGKSVTEELKAENRLEPSSEDDESDAKRVKGQEEN